jgi:hypothetical protein
MVCVILLDQQGNYLLLDFNILKINNKFNKLLIKCFLNSRLGVWGLGFGVWGLG